MPKGQPLFINFSQGVDTKTDPFQVPSGKFLSLVNSIFTTAGRLTKRNGYDELPAVPESATFLTTFNNNLTATGQDIQVFSESTGTWVNKGPLQPCRLNVLPLIRSDLNQSQIDSAVAPNGLVCTVYTDQTPTNTSVNRFMYAIADSVTGQNIIAPTVLSAADPTYGTPRVFILGAYFVIVYTRLISAAQHLSFIAVSLVNPENVTAPADLNAGYTAATTVAWDGAVLGNRLYISYNGSGGTGIHIVNINAGLVISATVIRDGAHSATLMSVAADVVNSIIWVSYYNSGTQNGYTLAINTSMNSVVTPKQIINTVSVANLTSWASTGVLTAIYEVINAYGYDSGIPTHYLRSITCNQAGTVGSPVTVVRSVGLASKAFEIDGTIYFLAAYQSPFQPTYFLLNLSGQVISKLAYGNGGGYLVTGLPSVTVTGTIAQMGYRIKDLVVSANSVQGLTKSGVYSQTGLNLVTFDLSVSRVVVGEIAQALHLTGGFLWEYDGYQPVEHNFYLWPDSIELTSTSGGSLAAQEYQYQVVYQWTDNQGNIHNSAPSITVSITLSSGTAVIIDVPTVRLTYKLANPIKIAIFRWSTAQQEFFEVTSIQNPLMNDPTVDYVTFTDTSADNAIIGNALIYTTGGVIENVGAPSFNSIALFDDRLWGISAEDPNSLWYSKQVLETTPVEMSDLQTFFVAPSTGAQGSTGAMQCIFPMDDKLVVFKKDAILYINGTGPDNTGANNQYSQPIFITSSVGSIIQESIAMTDAGLMFQSDKGIWLLERNAVSASYVGYPVEQQALSSLVNGASTVPQTTQSRFTLSNGTTLMYDYLFKQWGTFEGVKPISSTLYQGKHSILDKYGRVFQELDGSYQDGANPVLMSFTTGWLNLAGIMGYQRLYEFLLLGGYVTPNQIRVSIAYDFGNISESKIITPTNFTGVYGSDSLYGQTTPFGGPGAPLQWRVQPQKEKCQTFQITVQEVFNSAFGSTAGAGFTLSGILCMIGVKNAKRPIRSLHSVA